MSVAFGTSLSKTHLDAGTDDPAQARAELEAIIDRINNKLAGVTLLDSTDILDEDDFSSDSAVDAPSQQSAKAYIEARSVPIGGTVEVQTDITGAQEPDNSGDTGARWIKLTAGEDGAGEYNEGLLTSESVSGSSPTITATAVIDHAASPMNGQTVRLVNTEERFLRAGNAGTVQNSLFGSHNHGGGTGGAGNHRHGLAKINAGSSDITIVTTAEREGAQGGSLTFDNSGAHNVFMDASGNHGHSISSNGGNETRPRNVGITYYMRIA